MIKANVVPPNAYVVKIIYSTEMYKCETGLDCENVPTIVIEDDYIVYRDFVDISVAMATPKGLIVPILRIQCLRAAEELDLLSFSSCSLSK